MWRSAFTALLPNKTLEEEIMWTGFNKDGTVAYGHGYYNARKKVKVYGANVFGGINEIADIDFGQPELDWTACKFYAKRQELIWVHYVGNKATKMTIFNVEVGIPKRYEKEAADNIGNGQLISAIDDVLVFLKPLNERAFRLYQIQLNEMDETFSFTLLATVNHDLDVLSNFTTVVYYGENLLVFNPHDHDDNFRRLMCYEFATSQWFEKDVRAKFDPNTIDTFYLREQFDGKSFYVTIVVGSKIRVLKFDADALMWEEAFTDVCFRRELGMQRGRSMAFLLASSNGRAVFSFRRSVQISATLASVQFAVHWKKKMDLKEMCLGVLWPHIRDIFPESKRLSDHEICDRLMLTPAVLDVDLYFGKKFL